MSLEQLLQFCCDGRETTTAVPELHQAALIVDYSSVVVVRAAVCWRLTQRRRGNGQRIVPIGVDIVGIAKLDMSVGKSTSDAQGTDTRGGKELAGLCLEDIGRGSQLVARMRKLTRRSCVTVAVLSEILTHPRLCQVRHCPELRLSMCKGTVGALRALTSREKRTKASLGQYLRRNLDS